MAWHDPFNLCIVSTLISSSCTFNCTLTQCVFFLLIFIFELMASLVSDRMVINEVSSSRRCSLQFRFHSLGCVLLRLLLNRQKFMSFRSFDTLNLTHIVSYFLSLLLLHLVASPLCEVCWESRAMNSLAIPIFRKKWKCMAHCSVCVLQYPFTVIYEIDQNIQNDNTDTVLWVIVILPSNRMLCTFSVVLFSIFFFARNCNFQIIFDGTLAHREHLRRRRLGKRAAHFYAHFAATVALDIIAT